MTESLFGRLANAAPEPARDQARRRDQGAVRVGPALRLHHVRARPRRGRRPRCSTVLDAKVRGAIRGAISNSPQLSQTLVEKALAAPVDRRASARRRARSCASARAKVYEVARAPRFRESWDVYPFNSGYFMCVKLKGVDAETLRVHLLDHHQTGLISTRRRTSRIAFSCLEVDQVEPLFEVLHQGIHELRGADAAGLTSAGPRVDISGHAGVLPSARTRSALGALLGSTSAGAFTLVPNPILLGTSEEVQPATPSGTRRAPGRGSGLPAHRLRRAVRSATSSSIRTRPGSVACTRPSRRGPPRSSSFPEASPRRSTIWSSLSTRDSPPPFSRRDTTS